MKYFFFFSFLLLTIATPITSHGSFDKKELKTLVLIIASDDKPAYAELRKVWEKYMNKDPHFEVYFIQGDENLNQKCQITDHTIKVKCEESYKPGIFKKTILAIEALEDRIDEFDYILRTNLSSFYNFKALYSFLLPLPRFGCYAGFARHIPMHWLPQELQTYGTIPFASGAGFIISKDLAKWLVKEKEELFQHSVNLADDVLFGWAFHKNNIPIIQTNVISFQTLEEFDKYKMQINMKDYHFRAKPYYEFRRSDENFNDELLIVNHLADIFYKNEFQDKGSQ